MGFKLVNVAGRAALATDEHYYDVAEISGGTVSHEPMLALAASRNWLPWAVNWPARRPPAPWRMPTCWLRCRIRPSVSG